MLMSPWKDSEYANRDQKNILEHTIKRIKKKEKHTWKNIGKRIKKEIKICI